MSKELEQEVKWKVVYEDAYETDFQDEDAEERQRILIAQATAAFARPVSLPHLSDASAEIRRLVSVAEQAHVLAGSGCL